jgi:hypothetical protein
MESFRSVDSSSDRIQSGHFALAEPWSAPSLLAQADVAEWQTQRT